MLNNIMPQGLMKFKDTLRKRGFNKIGTHNIYEIKTVDLDGNVIDEKYGVNVLTNSGMQNLIGAQYPDQRAYMWVGTGTGTPATTDTALFAQYGTTSLTKTSSSFTTMPIEYDSTSGIISGIVKFVQSYMDYNITGVTTPIVLTEFGLSDSNTTLTLYTHSLIYDADGNVSSITKNINERLYITPYLVCNINKSILETAWTNGVYLLINPATEIFSRESKIYINKTSNNTSAGTTWSVTTSRSTVGNSCEKYDKIDQGYTILQDTAICYTDIGTHNAYTLSSDRVMFKPLKLETGEAVTLFDIITNNFNSASFSNTFDVNDSSNSNIAYRRGIYPITDYSITALNTYNSTTHDWDIPVNYSSPTNLDYMSFFKRSMNAKFTLNGEVGTYYVYANTRQNVPITSFDNSGIVIYATDSYWDTSTWTQISSLSAVDSTLQAKKYYITKTNVILKPNMLQHTVVPTKQPFTRISGATSRYASGSYSTVSNDTYKWIMIFPYVYFFDDAHPNGVERSLGSGSTIRNCSTGERLCLYFSSTKTFVIHDMTNGITSMPSTNVVLNFGTYTVPSSSISISSTTNGNGYVVAQSFATGVNAAVIIDIHNATQSLIDNVKNAYALKCTNYCVYQNAAITTGLSFVISDMSNGMSEVDTFSINEEGTVEGITGWGNNIYIRIKLTASSTYIVYLYKIQERNLILLSSEFTLPNLSTSNRTGVLPYEFAIDECIVFNTGNYDNKFFKYVNVNEPEVINQIDTNISLEIYGLKKVNMGTGSKIFIERRASSYLDLAITDFGPILDKVVTYSKLSSTDANENRYAYYDSGFIKISSDTTTEFTWYPMEYFISYKAEGTTKSFQCLNNPKKMTFDFAIKMTNDLTKYS